MNARFTQTNVSELKPCPPLCLSKSTSVADAVRQMQSHHCTSALVVDDRRLLGIITERDVLCKFVFERLAEGNMPVTEIMTTAPEVLYEDDSAAFALNEMSVLECRHITVVDKSSAPCGILTIEHILDHLDEKSLTEMVEPSEKKHGLRPECFDEPVQVLQPPEPLCLESGSALKSAVEHMVEANFGSVMIVKRKALIGILTERDILYKIAGKMTSIERLFVDEFMTAQPYSLRLNDPIRSAVKIFREHKVRHIPIVDDRNVPVAFMSVRGLMDYIVSFFAEEIINLPPHPLRVGASQAYGA